MLEGPTTPGAASASWTSTGPVGTTGVSVALETVRAAGLTGPAAVWTSRGPGWAGSAAGVDVWVTMGGRVRKGCRMVNKPPREVHLA